MKQQKEPSFQKVFRLIIFKLLSQERNWISEPSQEGERMLMQEGMRQELWMQEERYEEPQWMFMP